MRARRLLAELVAALAAEGSTGGVLGAALAAELGVLDVGVGVVLVGNDLDGVIVGGGLLGGLLVLALLHALADVLHGLAEGGADLREVLGPEDDQDDDKDDDELGNAKTKNHVNSSVCGDVQRLAGAAQTYGLV